MPGPSRGVRAARKLTATSWPPEVWPPVAWPEPSWPDPDPEPGPDLGGLVIIDHPLADPIALAADLFVEHLEPPPPPEANRWIDDPVGWITGYLGEFMYSKQKEIAEALRDNRRVAVPSAHEVGKSWLAARLCCWWLTVHEPGEAFVVTTAPSVSQVRAVLWREINRAHRKGNLPGRTNQTEWWIGDEMVAFGRKPADYSPTAFQGIHARRVLVILDEACGVPAEIYRAANSLIANELGRMLAIGNPDDPASHFAEVCAPGSGWTVLPVSAFDTPNFTSEEAPPEVKENLVNRIYTDELAADVGEDSPVYISKALGQFPESATAGVVPLSFVRECQRLDREYGPAELLPVELGMDVGAGGDETVVRERRGRVAGRTWRRHTPDWSQACAVLLEAIDATGATRVKIDVVGIGWGVVGRMRELRRQGRIGCEIVAVNVAMAAFAPEKYVRLRDQMWWEIGRELSRGHVWDLSSIDDTTVAQLIAPTWERDTSDRIRVEPKAQTKKRLKRSPDDADALLLAFYVPPRGALSAPAAGGQRRIAAARVRTLPGQARPTRRIWRPRPALPGRRAS